MPGSNRLSLVIQPAESHFICQEYSPDGVLANLGNPQVIFGQTPPRDQSGGALAAVHLGSRTYYTCRSNEGDNTVMLGSIGDSGGIFSPLSTGLGIIGDPFPSAPGIATLGGRLYLFYRPWYQGQGKGSTWCVPVTITDSEGHFTLGSPVAVDGYNAGGGRISAVTAGGNLCCTWVDPYNENAYGDLQFSFSSDGTTWHSVVCYYDPGFKNAVQGSGSLLVLPDSTLVLGWRDGRNSALTYSVFTFESSTAGYWGPAQTVPGVTLLDEPSWMTSTDGTSVVVACRSGSNVQAYRLSPALNAVIESRLITNLSVGSSPTVLFHPDL